MNHSQKQIFFSGPQIDFTLFRKTFLHLRLKSKNKSMTRKKIINLSIALSLSVIPYISFSQKNISGTEMINSEDLDTYVSFLASPSMKGRSNGGPELEITVNFLASQAKLMGLKPANGTSYLQPYSVMKQSIDPKESTIKMFGSGIDSVQLTTPMLQIYPVGTYDFEIEGEVAFAGYGIKADKYKYNDLENIELKGRILLLMNRAPLSEDGTSFLFEEPVWRSLLSIQAKLRTLCTQEQKQF